MRVHTILRGSVFKVTINQTFLSDEDLHLSTSPFRYLPECQTPTPKAQVNDPSSAGQELQRDDNVSHNDKEKEDGANISNDHDDSGSSHVGDLCSKRRVSDDVQTAQPVDGAGTDEGLSALGVGSSCGTFASTTGSSGNSGEQAESGGLLKGAFAVALSGHWRAAELQFDDTTRRVRNVLCAELRTLSFGPYKSCHPRVNPVVLCKFWILDHTRHPPHSSNRLPLLGAILELALPVFPPFCDRHSVSCATSVC